MELLRFKGNPENAPKFVFLERKFEKGEQKGDGVLRIGINWREIGC